MTISIREVGTSRIVEVKGDVDLSTSGELRTALFASLASASLVALNLEAIVYMDSSGIATLIEVFKDSQRRKKEFVLFGMSPKVDEVFRLTHVDRIFRIFKTEQQALGIA